MKIGGHDVGVCSWSLKPKNMAELVTHVRQLGLEHIQLSTRPLLELDETQRREEMNVLRDSGLKITAGMINFHGEDYSSISRIRETGGLVPEGEYSRRLQEVIRAGALCRELGVNKLSTHIGFIPPSNHEMYKMMVQRMSEAAKPLLDNGVTFLMETGQETASELLQFLNDVGTRNVAVNFDPANMILYGAGDPIAAVRTLGRHIHHVHIKDAKLSDHPAVKWGEEVPFGKGEVGPAQFLGALRDAGYTGPLVIEREAGNNRMADVATAIESIRAAVMS